MMKSMYEWWVGFQDKVVATVAALMLIGTTLVAGVEVLRRYVLGLSFHWQQDVVTYVSLAALFLFFAVAQQQQAHLRVTVLLELLQNRGSAGKTLVRVLSVVFNVFGLALITTFVYWGIPLAQRQFDSGLRTPSLALPMWPFFVILLLGFCLMGITLFFQVYNELQILMGKKGFITDAQEDTGAIL